MIQEYSPPVFLGSIFLLLLHLVGTIVLLFMTWTQIHQHIMNCYLCHCQCQLPRSGKEGNGRAWEECHWVHICRRRSKEGIERGFWFSCRKAGALIDLFLIRLMFNQGLLLFVLSIPTNWSTNDSWITGGRWGLERESWKCKLGHGHTYRQEAMLRGEVTSLEVIRKIELFALLKMPSFT